MSLRAQEFLGYWVIATIVVLFLVYAMLMSPLGVGFQDMPHNPYIHRFFLGLYKFLYWIGSPALLLAHGVSSYFGFSGKRRLAYKTSLISISLFVSGAVLALALLP